MKVTLKDIAQRAGVSVNTVSLALRDMPSVKQETRETILRLADELGYYDQKSKQDMHNIGLISTGERLRDSYFYMSFHQYILNTAHENDYNMMVFKGANCDVAPDELRHKFEANSIAGVIILGDMKESVVAKVAGCGIPVVATGARYHDLSICTVIEDNLEGAYKAVRYLAERGYREIGFIGLPQYSTGYMERYQGYIGAMRAFDLPVEQDSLILDLDIENVYCYENLQRVLLAKERLPQAFLCANDNLAMVTSKVLHERGLSVPDDVALMGFDNSIIGKMAMPAITSVDVRCQLQAEVCVQKLIELIQGGEQRTERIVLETSIVEGESVGVRAPAQEAEA